MILQRLQYPEAGDNERGMYYRFIDGKCYATADKTRLLIGKGCTVQFNTYFNSFSYGKWKKYTILDDLRLRLNLKGACEVILICHDLMGETVEEYTLYRQKVFSDEMRAFDFVYPETAEKGIVGFKITAFEDSETEGGYYYSETNENDLDDVNLALCICTYRRENYINSNMKMLKENVFTDKNSILNEHLKVYIADNGKTLNPCMFDCGDIKIYPNINAGGAGGFSRAIMEANKDRKEYKFTHAVLMDDDVIFTHYALERGYSFLKFVKPEYKNIMLGGAMLKLDLPYMQFANGETWDAGKIIFNKINYNLYDMKYVLRNETEESINQLAWWFCFFPMDDNAANNLALPVFFQYDDIDFNQRNKHLKKVTLNGVCLWHEPFEKKFSDMREYYALRNKFIVMSVYGGGAFTKKYIKKSVRELIIRNLFMYRYKAADLILRAVEDYFRGFEWLASVNPEKLNNEITEAGHKFQTLDELGARFIYTEYAGSLTYSETKFKRILRLLTFNGYLLKPNRDSTVSAISDIKANYFRARRVLNYNESTSMGFYVEKNIKEARKVWKRMRSVFRLIDKKFKKTVESYRRDYGKYITSEFWEKYLKTD